VSFSKSEGVGMGAVEAALRNKPVITTGYGGSTEYVKTPYMIRCDKGYVEQDDFLFQKGMEWGDPKFDDLLKFMTDAYEKKLKFMDGSHTQEMVSGENVRKEFTSSLQQCSWSREQ
jgi:glycosyltransferase involved in cell wall biosynthesis